MQEFTHRSTSVGTSNRVVAPHSDWTFALFLKTLGLISAYLFLLGWAYQYGYFSAFGIGSSLIDLPTHQFLIFSISVLSHPTAVIIAFVAGVYSVTRLAGFLPSNRWSLPIDLVAIAAVFLLSYVVAYDIGETMASEHALVRDSRLPGVSFEFASKSSEDELSSPCALRLLLYSNDIFFVFCPVSQLNSDLVPVRLVPGRSVISITLRRRSTG